MTTPVLLAIANNEVTSNALFTNIHTPKINLITYKEHVANFSRLVVVLLLYSLTRLEMPALNHIGG